MTKKMKTIIWVIAIIGVVCLTSILVCNIIIVNNAKGKLFSDIEQVAPSEYGLLLGTTPQTRIGRRQNQFFKFRIDAAEHLYKARKIKHILISGDENSLDGVNEVECMKDSITKELFILQNILALKYMTFRAIMPLTQHQKWHL